MADTKQQPVEYWQIICTDTKAKLLHYCGYKVTNKKALQEIADFYNKQYSHTVYRWTVEQYDDARTKAWLERKAKQAVPSAGSAPGSNKKGKKKA